jgi:hypothetical protein
MHSAIHSRMRTLLAASAGLARKPNPRDLTHAVRNLLTLFHAIFYPRTDPCACVSKTRTSLAPQHSWKQKSQSSANLRHTSHFIVFSPRALAVAAARSKDDHCADQHITDTLYRANQHNIQPKSAQSTHYSSTISTLCGS